MNLRFSGAPLRAVLAVLAAHRRDDHEAIMALADSRTGVEITLEPVKRKRSTDQNARYWAIVTKLAEAYGDTKNGMHEELLCEYHGYDLREIRGHVKKIPRGRSKNLNTMDFAALSDIAERWCAEAGVWVEAS